MENFYQKDLIWYENLVRNREFIEPIMNWVWNLRCFWFRLETRWWRCVRFLIKKVILLRIKLRNKTGQLLLRLFLPLLGQNQCTLILNPGCLQQFFLHVNFLLMVSQMVHIPVWLRTEWSSKLRLIILRKSCVLILDRIFPWTGLIWATIKANSSRSLDKTVILTRLSPLRMTK